MQSKGLIMPYRLHRKPQRDLRRRQVGAGLIVRTRWQFLHLVDEPLILPFGFVCRVACVVEQVENFKDPFTISERETAVHAVTVRAVDGRADEIVWEEVFDHARGVGAEDAVGLEEEDVSRWSDLIVNPTVGKEFADGRVVVEGDV